MIAGLALYPGLIFRVRGMCFSLLLLNCVNFNDSLKP